MKTVRIIPGLLFLVIAFACLASACFASADTPSGVRHGTIAVVYYTSSKIVIAGDSRATEMGFAPNDMECKIAALGSEIIFVSTGIAGYDSGDPRFPIPSWRSSDEAHKAYERLTAGGRRPSVADVANEWSRAMVRNETQLYGIVGERLLDAANDGVLTQAMFGGVGEDGTLQMVSADIVLQEDESDKSHPIDMDMGVMLPQDSLGVIGEGAIFKEFFEAETDRAKKEAAQWEKDSAKFPEDDRIFFKMIRLIDLTSAYDEMGVVGGPIDAVELDLGKGIRWRQRKANCPAS
jgi:hypothetical protein